MTCAFTNSGGVCVEFELKAQFVLQVFLPYLMSRAGMHARCQVSHCCKYNRLEMLIICRADCLLWWLLQQIGEVLVKMRLQRGGP